MMKQREFIDTQWGKLNLNSFYPNPVSTTEVYVDSEFVDMESIRDTARSIMNMMLDQLDNDFYNFINGQDRYYTNGS